MRAGASMRPDFRTTCVLPMYGVSKSLRASHVNRACCTDGVTCSVALGVLRRGALDGMFMLPNSTIDRQEI